MPGRGNDRQRFAGTLSRMMRAWEHACELRHESHAARRASRQTRAERHTTALTDSPLPSTATPANDLIVWTTEDAAIRCYVVPHSVDEHEVVVMIHGRVVWSRTFADPVEATDESLRARRLFVAEPDEE